MKLRFSSSWIFGWIWTYIHEIFWSKFTRFYIINFLKYWKYKKCQPQILINTTASSEFQSKSSQRNSFMLWQSYLFGFWLFRYFLQPFAQVQHLLRMRWHHCNLVSQDLHMRIFMEWFKVLFQIVFTLWVG